jgi:ketosteroid isomerase-like protein
MSEENVDVVRRMYEALDRHDGDAALSCFAEDCVCEDAPGVPDHTTYRGGQGVRRRERRFRETWGDLAWAPLQFIDAEDDQVVAVVAMHAHGRASDIPVDFPAVFLYEVRDGLIVRDRPYWSKSQAFDAAGLSE